MQEARRKQANILKYYFKEMNVRTANKTELANPFMIAFGLIDKHMAAKGRTENQFIRITKFA